MGWRRLVVVATGSVAAIAVGYAVLGVLSSAGFGWGM